MKRANQWAQGTKRTISGKRRLCQKICDVIEEVKIGILKELLKTQKMNMEVGEKLLKFETSRKIKSKLELAI